MQLSWLHTSNHSTTKRRMGHASGTAACMFSGGGRSTKPSRRAGAQSG